MSETESQEAQIAPAVEADRVLPAVQQTPPYSLVPLSTQIDAAALARFTEGLPTVKLTDDERRIDVRSLQEVESEAAEERRTLLRESLPQYDAHLRKLRARIKAGELLPNEPVPQYGEVYVGWMGATQKQVEELDQQLLDLEARTEQTLAVVENRFQRDMQSRLREKAGAIVPSDLATVREALYQYEKTENPNEATLVALREQYRALLEARRVELIQGMSFAIVCRACGIPFHVETISGDEEEAPPLFCKSACEKAFNEAILRDHPEWRAVQKEYAETVQKQYAKALDRASIYGKESEVKKGTWDSEWLYDCLEDIGGQRVVSIVKGNYWGLQCWSCNKYFKTPSEMPENFPAKKWHVCSWNCLVFRAPGRAYIFSAFDEFIDSDLSAGSPWWDTIEHTTFPPTSWAQVERRLKPKQPRSIPQGQVINVDAPAFPAPATHMLSSPAKPTMAERILGVLHGLGGQVIEDRALRKAAGVTAVEVGEYVKERDRLTHAGQIGRRGTGHRGSAFKFWAQ